MYQQDEWDQALLRERVAEFRDQTRRFLAGQLSEDAYRPLRLMNGLYVQRHAPMLRVAIPYGALSSHQLRGLAHVAEHHDRGYGHFTTRQNIQFNWLKLESVPDVLAELAEVGLHAIQTSGNCIRNVTTDPLAGLLPGEVDDPRPWCELIRQWATLNPEFSFLPRKFKIAVSGRLHDRAACRIHDLGLELKQDDRGRPGFRVWIGGGLGREPHLAQCLREFLPADDLIDYLTAVLRVYNQAGRRDHLYKSRIKILVKSLGIEAFSALVDAAWKDIIETRSISALAALERIKARFVEPAHDPALADDRIEPAPTGAFARWLRYNTREHRVPGYRVVFILLKGLERAPGDLTAVEMRVLADLADQQGFGLLQTTYDQNLLLPHIPVRALREVWQTLDILGLANPGIGTVNDLIACPGLDYCNLANAATLPLAQQVQQRFQDLDYLHDLGEVHLRISGCMNGCAHHHLADIGLLGVEKQNGSWFQLLLGGCAGSESRLGRVLGPALQADQVPDAIETILALYAARRLPGEPFAEAVQRIGLKTFKETVYEQHDHSRRATHYGSLAHSAG
ncbi:nitrite/sulfite reductase [Ectothiorhodospira lacustris]|uniref:nitrite/sulfite reductase n=1 Tax=Ectothiorhodospira lacustris TaxID=2899127 RepID=UPI001EE8E7D5|nr:nitrite/sulfite reductase [Ectothiorhodospira lacustris]MCG5500205.1 nitrite/sulfite reductase [Ectothiorhodospira lacustris]MCG5509571.1 nitrite/sulfite reductase [Ectothiorhodospira lacustris]MCG5521634.1 nitrite/sulfite reductase [Ectothiorhodospira lacustris]